MLLPKISTLTDLTVEGFKYILWQGHNIIKTTLKIFYPWDKGWFTSTKQAQAHGCLHVR